MADTKIVKPAGFAKPTTPPPAQINTGSGTPAGSYVPTTAGANPIVGKTRVPTFTSEIYAPDPTYSKFVTNTVYQNLMGRDATEAEAAKYHEMFSNYAKTHPILTKQSTYDTSNTTGLSPLIPVRDVTAQKTPLSEQDFISNIVRQGPEAKQFTAATTYFDAMREAMGSFRGGY
jgi:hypothetical protein